jgi:hypothetical protein
VKSTRLLLALLAALSIAVIVLSVRIVQLQHSLTHAELYVQAGVANWEHACKNVVTGLTYHGKDPAARRVLYDVAWACMSRTDTTDKAGAEAFSRDFDSDDPSGVIRRIERAIETRDYFMHSDRVTGYFPKGY